MSNITGYATPSLSMGTLGVESFEISPEVKAQAVDVISSWRSGEERDEILAMLGLTGDE